MRDEKGLEVSFSKCTRRNFLKGSAVGAAGAMLGSTGCSALDKEGHKPVPKDALPEGKSKVVLIRENAGLDSDETVMDMLERAMIELTAETDGATAWSKFIRPDDVVGVKINVMMTTTWPKISQAVTRGIMSAGVPEQKIIVWDGNDAGRGLGGSQVRNERLGFDSKSLSRIVTNEATALVNVPGMKAHRLAGVAVALKNWIGAITASINAIPAIRDKCRLIIVDALEPLFHGGPQVNPRYLWPYRGIIIGTDPVAVDTVCIKILEAKRREFKGADWPISPTPKHVFLAESKYKLGHANIDNIELVKLGWQEGVLV